MYEMEKRGKKLRRINERKRNLSFFIAETIVIMWVLFALAAFIWAFIASFSTTRSIFSGNLFSEGLNFKGYRVVFVEYKIMRNFFNSLIYTTLACIGILLISAPGAYVISKYSFIGGTALRSFLAASTGLPSVMILVPVFMTIVRMNAANSMLTLIAVYIAAGVPVSLYYLTGFFATLPS
ncbi:MAG: transporter, permease protein, partial [Oscillospiraceae bacterium]|nr:transporter, permease protein [Oscillospiraceae bacterium]